MSFVKNGQELDDVRYVTSNVIIHEVQRGKNHGNVVILGPGDTLDIDNDGKIIWHDPFMPWKNLEDFFLEKTKVLVYYYTSSCQGLEAAGRDIAEYVNYKYENRGNKIFFIGHSKSALCLYNATQYVSQMVDLALITISAPYKGTVMASNKTFSTPWKWIVKKISFKEVKENKIKLEPIMWLIQKIALSGHNVDNDIIPGADFLKILPQNLRDDIVHYNVVSKMSGIKFCKSFLDYACAFFEWAMPFEGDGIVSVESQRKTCFWQNEIISSHASSLEEGLIEVLYSESLCDVI